MTRFRACIDIHQGKVKQLVGGSIDSPFTITNFTSTLDAAHYAKLYKDHRLMGSHVIKLGPGCDEQARSALEAWPQELQLGGGITPLNAGQWLEAGAQKVILTSWLFPDAAFSKSRLEEMVEAVSRYGGKERIVLDLSCKRVGGEFIVAMDRWTRLTDMKVTTASLQLLASYCSEFLVHAADVEGLCRGIDEDLIRLLASSPIPCTYAGGAKSVDDLATVHDLGHGRVDLTFGSCLDIFGGSVSFASCVEASRRLATVG